MSIETMKDAKESAKKMNELFMESKLQEAAEIGMEILAAFSHLALIERESYQACFNKITMEQFYKHVISKARWCIDRYSRK